MEFSDLMTGASEVGSLKANSNDDSQFVGSSSGVYFINTVRQAFTKSFGQHGDTSSTHEFPAAEDTIVGYADSPQETTSAPNSRGRHKGYQEDISTQRWKYDRSIGRVLGEAPNLEQARKLMMAYFKVWHPLFPFLHGPSFLSEMERFYSENSPGQADNQVSRHKSSCWTTIFQCVFNLGIMLRPDIEVPPHSKIQSPAEVHSIVGSLLDRHDVLALQALLAAQLYLVATMSLRTASLLGGCILRSMLHAGLHRCPFRYNELTSHDCHLRKRIFWCAYAIDRYLSQALGLPLGIQDSDLDVCLPGTPERHFPLPQGQPSSKVGSQQPSDIRISPPEPGEKSPETARRADRRSSSQDSVQAQPDEQVNREATLGCYVMWGKLTGRALELFHKSIQFRTVRRSSVLYLVSDVHKWWNSLPPNLQGLSSGGPDDQITSISKDDEAFDMRPFFSVLYEYLILLINRPLLSLQPSSPDFCSGLQTCLGAARGILSALKTQVSKGQALFWPGFLSAAYMAGLVIAFACQLKQYVLVKGCREIGDCLSILRAMSAQWETAKHCQNAMSYLLLSIQTQRGKRDMYLPFDFDSDGHSTEESAPRASTPPHLPESGSPTNAKRQKISHADRSEELTAEVGGPQTVYDRPSGLSGVVQPPNPARKGAPSSSMSPPTVLADASPDNNIPDEIRLEYADRTTEQHNRLRAVQNRFYSQTPNSVMPPNEFGPSPTPPAAMMGPSVSGNHYYPPPDAWGNGLGSFSFMTSTQSPLNLSGLEDPQWPGGSASATNFDLNMTDLFQGPVWESLLEGFNPQHSQSSPQPAQADPSQSSLKELR